MITIGLLGGIASGKSTVAKLLAQHGAVVLDADHAAHEALQSAEVIDAVVGRWGQQLIGTDGQLVRRAIAERVFGHDDVATTNRRFLEGLIHPRVRITLQTELARLKKQGQRAVVLDIPLLLEAGWGEECQLLLFVDAPAEIRQARAAQRGWGQQELAWREAAQLPIEEKKAQASAIVNSGGSRSELDYEVGKFWERHVAPRLTKTSHRK